MDKHISVLKKEVTQLLELEKSSDQVVIDCTLGSGGHSLEILDKMAGGTLICFDTDENAINHFKNTLTEEYSYEISLNESILSRLNSKSNQIEVILVNDNFSKVKDYVKELSLSKITAILADLGWSSDQLDHIEGLSYQNDEGELDMRLDKTLSIKAKDFLNALGRSELNKTFMEYADLTNSEANKFSNAVLSLRKSSRFEKVKDLSSLIESEFKNKNVNQQKSRIFQALRIAVNSEFISLMSLLNGGIDVLSSGGNFAVITFHSGEEKIVEKVFDRRSKEGEVEYISQNKNNKYIQPSFEELKLNIRSRSAKLWVINKI